jgi:hypothetical protein
VQGLHELVEHKRLGQLQATHAHFMASPPGLR